MDSLTANPFVCDYLLLKKSLAGDAALFSLYDPLHWKFFMSRLYLVFYAAHNTAEQKSICCQFSYSRAEN